ncbi:hypothetical protein HXX76_002164 [Chlamydomonas incerta]|uniref:Peptidase M11 gametolysin domain-containing protein n=1 Tax=Chlamydomonas incerta TaxID=51695 RepID=A0A835WAK3_CHLIN|nr:hypothetical protein HXX76_002164 [Chlamydomonas incerta]|eukprot:KAG2443821.1 hypothetical protein HXX76_002164 [Chlamydomonas incerta]
MSFLELEGIIDFVTSNDGSAYLLRLDSNSKSSAAAQQLLDSGVRLLSLQPPADATEAQGGGLAAVLQRAGVRLGDRVSLVCGLVLPAAVPAAADRRARCLSVLGVKRLSTQYGSGEQAGSALGGRQFGLMALMEMDCSAGWPQGLGAAALAILGQPLKISSISVEAATAWLQRVDQELSGCSRGTLRLAVNDSEVLPVAVPCTLDWMLRMRTCDTVAASENLRDLMLQRIPLEYTRADVRILVVPALAVTFCGWRGVALPGDRQVVLPAGIEGDAAKGTSLPWLGVHEVLHLFGLQHAGTAASELSPRATSTEGDPTSPMGCEGCGPGVSICPNAPQMYYLGWADPLAELDEAALPIGRAVQLTIPLQSKYRVSLVRLLPTWLPPASYTHNLYLSFRRADDDEAGNDSIELGLDASYSGKLLVHQAGAAHRLFPGA